MSGVIFDEHWSENKKISVCYRLADSALTGISSAPCFLNSFSCFSLLSSITLRFLKYSTCRSRLSLCQHLVHQTIGGEYQITQLGTQSFSNSICCLPHCAFASLSRFILSIIPFLSRHSKKASLASQHFFLSFRSGAIGFSSGVELPNPNQLMIDECSPWRKGLPPIYSRCTIIAFTVPGQIPQDYS